MLDYLLQVVGDRILVVLLVEYPFFGYFDLLMEFFQSLIFGVFVVHLGLRLFLQVEVKFLLELVNPSLHQFLFGCQMLVRVRMLLLVRLVILLDGFQQPLDEMERRGDDLLEELLDPRCEFFEL